MNATEYTVHLRCPLVVLIAILILPSCALTPETVRLNPQVQSAPTAPVAAGQPVSLVIIDMRPSGVLGNRGLTGTAYGGANVSTSGDITQDIQPVIADSLAARGFTVTPTKRKTQGIQLRVEITNLQYAVVPGIITGTLRTEAGVHADCLRDQVSQYDHMHRGESEEQVFFAQFAKENEAHINTALSNAITSMFNDADLLSCLSGQ